MADYPATDRRIGCVRVRRYTPVALRYSMTGWHPGLLVWVSWEVIGVPDRTGAQSGYPGVLTNISWEDVRYGTT